MAMPGDFNSASNKDGILFPDFIDGHCLRLLRPMDCPSGDRLLDGRLEHDLDAALFNLQSFDPSRTDEILEARIDRIMVPETDCKINDPCQDSVANVLFTCGSHCYRQDLYILYGGGDTFVMSARVPLQALVKALEAHRAPRPDPALN